MMRLLRLFQYSFLLCVIGWITGCSSDDDSPKNQPDIEENDTDPKDIESMMIFPGGHPLNMDVSSLPVDPNSDAILSNIGLTKGLFADFGSGLYEGSIIGIPYVAVTNDQPPIQVTYRSNNYDGNYGDESDPGPFPIPLSIPLEGGGEGDSHAITVNVDDGMLYELYNASVNGNTWEASSGAVFNLNNEEYRPLYWTSADAAGLPIFPLLVRYTEIEENGEIDHAIRFTIRRSAIYEGFVHPARHLVSGETNSNLLPFGGRLRLKNDVDISSFSETNQVILSAMKKHGLILADVGSDMFISGAPHDDWDNSDLKELGQIKVTDFDVLELGEIIGN